MSSILAEPGWKPLRPSLFQFVHFCAVGQMRRTRKWAYVAQEAKRLADLGLSPVEIAKRLEVERRTVDRWMAAGKLKDTRRSAKGKGAVTPKSPKEWAASVRAAYALDATDEELVGMGEIALEMIHNPYEAASVKQGAMGRFVAIVKQLALVARGADGGEKPAAAEQKPAPPQPRRRAGPDPRSFLQAVK